MLHLLFDEESEMASVRAAEVAELLWEIKFLLLSVESKSFIGIILLLVIVHIKYNLN